MLQITPPLIEVAPRGPSPLRSPPRLSDWIREIRSFIRRRYKFIAGPTAAVVALGALYLILKTPEYTGAASVLIDATRPPASQQRQIFGDPVAEAANIESQIEVFKSDVVAAGALSRLRLVEDPEFWGKPSWLSALTGILKQKLAGGAVIPVDPKRDAIRALQERLDVRRVGLSYVLVISVRAPDPTKAAQVTQAVAEAFIEEALATRSRASQQALTWLQDRLNEFRASAERADRAVQEFKEQHGMIATTSSSDSKGQFLDQRRVDELNTQLTIARAQAIEAEARIRRVQEVTGSVQSSTSSDLAVARSKIDSLEKDLAEAISALQEADRHRAALSALEASAQSFRMMFQNFVQRYAESLQTLYPSVEARIVSPAEPPRGKSSPKGSIVIPVSLVVGLSLGLLWAFSVEKFDRGFRMPADAESALGLSALGVVRLPKDRFLSAEPPPGTSDTDGHSQFTACLSQTLGAPGASFRRALECIISTIELQNLVRPVKVIGVTSTLRGEGKSTVAQLFAASVSQYGRRALLIDLDFGRECPDSTDSTGFGVVDIIKNLTNIENAVKVDQVTGLNCLSTGIRGSLSRVEEVLHSSKVEQLLAKACERYELVILDLPPLLPPGDFQATAKWCDGIVVVIRLHETDQELVADALNRAAIPDDKALGAILTV